MSDIVVPAENRIIVRIDASGRKKQDDLVIREHALTIILSDGQFVKDRRYVTMFCSPSDLEVLGLGFLLSEGLISSMDDVESISISDDSNELSIQLTSSARLADNLLAKRDITSGCARSMNPHDFLDSFHISGISSNVKVPAEAIFQLSRDFQLMSKLYKSTGGTHAAALCDVDSILIFKEDIGRHNAIDKVLGVCLMKHIETNDKIVHTSGRISSEILLKVAKRGIPIIASRSAPTSMALQLAEKAGVTIVGFVRGGRMNIYSHDYRIE